MSVLAFPELAPACAPPEVAGRSRADVALLVATRADDGLRLARFEELPRFLRPGDLLVVNTSLTVAAALRGRLADRDLLVHLSTPLGRGRWVVELRGAERERIERPPLGTTVELPEHGRLTLLAPHEGSGRLSEAQLVLPHEQTSYLERHGQPIRYGHCVEDWPIGAHQTIFANEPGSAEMPSAGRPFTPALVATLHARGVHLAPVTLHTGVSSLELDETPYPERFRVPAETARLANRVHESGGRVIAVGTTVARALETAARDDGRLEGAAGWTSLVITPERGLRALDGLLSGWHEPESSHLWMLEAAAGPELLARSYALAAQLALSGHEFGDAHLILP
ncbi:MAG: S-adenosylmethionine:tRNA ribosyltransferase-isomerase [Solirubrobacteraceae bacterium]